MSADALAVRQRNKRWWYLGAAGVLVLAVMMGIGLMGHRGFSLFNASVGASNSLGTGTVTLDLNGSSATTTTWSLTNSAPGDYFEEPATLSNTGSIGIGTVTLAAPAPSSTTLFSDTVTEGSATEDAVYVYMLDCQGGTWTQSSSGTPYTCTPSTSGGTVTVTTALGAAPACASSSNLADLSTCETSSYWMNPSGDTTVDDVAPSGAVGITASGVPSTNLTLPTTTGASGAKDVLTAKGGSQTTANVLFVEYVNPNLGASAENQSSSVSFNLTGVQRAGVLS